jgi:hypothetical protein
MIQDNEFDVEGRYFPNSLYAYAFAEIQADLMDRPVEVHIKGFPHPVLKHKSTWHATAHPSNFVRRHLVTET